MIELALLIPTALVVMTVGCLSLREIAIATTNTNTNYDYRD